MKKTKQKTLEDEIGDLYDKYNLKISSQEQLETLLLKSIRPFLEKTLNAEMDEHLGYKKHEQNDNDNSRNGYSEKTVRGLFGQTTIKTPRDRDGSFEPIIVEKNKSNISRIEQSIIKLYAKGTSTRDIVEYIKDIYHCDLEPTSISRITDKVIPEIEAFQTRTLDKTYAMIFIDGIRFKVREESVSKDVSVYVVMGVNLHGQKDVLGYWIGESETSKYWVSVLNDIKLRGVEEILIISCDNLKGISEAISAVFPKTKIQKCIVHQIRNSTKFVRYDHLKEFTSDMKLIYKAINIQDAEQELTKFEEKWNKDYGYAVKSWRQNFEELTTFFEFPLEIRTLIYTTNPIENLNRNIRKISKNKSFPNLKSLSKIIYLALKNQTEKWTLPLKNWGSVFNQLTILFDLK